MVQKNACAVWDYTIPEKSIECETLKKWCKLNCKAWCFQMEKGEGGYIHWQVRVSLKTKTRTPPKPVIGCNFSPTSDENKDNFYYVSKEETRIGECYKDTDPDIFIPKQYRNILDKLKPFQKEILDSRNKDNFRKINFLYDEKGNIGKSSIAALAEILYGGIDCPPINDCKELMQIMACECIDSDNRSPGIVFIDLPRAMDKERLFGIFTAIEQIKKGKLYDTRYHYKKYWINSPEIWVFSNSMPDINYLSADRWTFYKVSPLTNKLVEFEADKSCNNAQIQKKRLI